LKYFSNRRIKLKRVRGVKEVNTNLLYMFSTKVRASAAKLKEQEEEIVKNKKKVKTTHDQVVHVTRDIKINRFDVNQLGIEEETVADSREGQMLYSRAVKKSLPQTQ
ncbi:3815_t:CDS:2, partial [Gigaspora margarita]